MRLLIAAAAVLVLSLGCVPHPPPTVGGPSTTPDSGVATGFVDCISGDAHDVAVHILPAVATAIASGDYVGQLGNLIAQFGAGAVTCAVSYLEGELSAVHFAGAADAEAETMLEHARAFLKMPPVKPYVAPMIHMDPDTLRHI